MKENFTYPAIFDYSEDGEINITFPDFPGALSCVEDESEAIEAAQEILAMTISDFTDRNVPLPEEGIIPGVEKEQKVVFINIWMPYFRKRIKETYVKKTLTIPVWLDQLAKESQINFSAVLVEGLKQKLGLNVTK